MRRPTDDKVLHHARCNVYCYPDEPDMSLERRESPTRRSEEGVDLRRRQLHRLRPLLSRVYGRRPALTDPSLPRSISSTLKSGDFLATRRAWGLVLDLYNDDHWLLNRLNDRSLSPKRDE